jgi:phosphorylase kinase alpha/beta subunit
MNKHTIQSNLDKHFQEIDKIILSRQNPLTGLLPASTAVNTHGDYTDAWVRDNVYSILAVWGLSLAYKKYQPDHYRAHVLSMSVVKLMRGLLRSMMKQSDKVERFKHSLNPIDALHAKYGTDTGSPVVNDDEWGHLQLDATSLYLLQLAQMTASGLQIIYTVDEVNFIQNLVHYISRTYCIPDFGIWERGNKTNHGKTEVNCSSVGMAKAALEALSGFNLFINCSGNEGVIHTSINDIARSRFTLHGQLPKESNSKETDAALLSIIGYPAYAVEDKGLVKLTKEKIIDKLAGNYGCKRFLLDGHQSTIEDASKLHYDRHELKEFEHIESEWPLFFTYLLLDAYMKKDQAKIEKWKSKLEPLFVEQEGSKLLPELYYVPKELIEAEKQKPGSQKKEPNENVPLVWAQSLYMLCSMLEDEVLQPSDIDPLKRRDRTGAFLDVTPLIAVVSQNQAVKQQLRNIGIQSETLEEIAPIKVMYSDELTKVHTMLGRNERLGLSGKPPRETRTITTSFLYKIADQEIIFLPYYFNPKGFYFSYDNQLLVKHFESSVKVLADNWDRHGQPIITFFVRQDMLSDQDKEVVLKLLHAIQENNCKTLRVKSGFISLLKHTAAVEKIDYIHGMPLHDIQYESIDYLIPADKMGYKLKAHTINHLEALSTDELIEMFLNDNNRLKVAVILEILIARESKEYRVKTAATDTESLTLGEIIQINYESASHYHDWAVIRRLAQLSQKVDDRLEDALLEIIIHQKQLAVGRAYDEKAVIIQPYDTTTIIEHIALYCGSNAAENVLTQEIILHLGHIIRAEPELFKNILTLRTWYFVQLLVSKISREKNIPMGESYEYLISLSPFEIYSSLYEVLQRFVENVDQLSSSETINSKGKQAIDTKLSFAIDTVDGEHLKVEDWLEWRKEVGMIGHIDKKTQEHVWKILQRCSGVVIGDKYDINSRIGQEDIFELTSNERQFELLIDRKLQRIHFPEYKQLNIELIETLSSFLGQNEALSIQSDLIFDVIIGYAVRLAWYREHEAGNYDEEKGKAWNAFYQLEPQKISDAYVEALVYLIEENDVKEQ